MRLDKPQIRVGEKIHLTLVVKHAARDALIVPSALDLGQEVTLLSQTRNVQADGPMLTETLNIDLTAYQVGTYEIPAWSLKVADQEFFTTLQKFEVVSVLPKNEDSPKNDTEQASSRPVLERQGDGAPLSLYENLYWPFLMLGFALLIAAVVLVIKKWPKKPAVMHAFNVKETPADQAAMQLIAQLKAKQYLEKHRFREFYFELSEIVRGYISKRYAINALDLTTFELMSKLAAYSAPGLDRDGLKRWLEHADLVKFAKFEPESQLPLQMLQFFEHMIVSTRLVPVPTSEVTFTDNQKEASS